MGRRKWRTHPSQSRLSDRPFDCKDARSTAPFFWSPCLRQSSGQPDAALAEKLRRQNARSHTATPLSRSSQSRNKRVRTGAARSRFCVPSCKAPARRSPRPLVAAVCYASLRRFLRSLLHSNALMLSNALSFPLQTPLTPSPNEPFNQEQQKNQYRDECADRQTNESHC